MVFYHVWFATKGRRWLLQGEIVDAAKASIRAIAEAHSVRLLECEAVVDHVHLLLEFDAEADLPKAMMVLKGTSARRLFQQFPETKLDARTTSFWQGGYGRKLVAPEALAATRRYIQTQWQRLDDYERMPRGSARGALETA